VWGRVKDPPPHGLCKVSGTASPLSHKGETTLNLLRCRSGEVLKEGRNGDKMYTGTLIDELMKTVERTERRAMQVRSQEEKLSYFYTVAESELVPRESNLVGAA